MIEPRGDKRQHSRITRGFMVRYRNGIGLEAPWFVSPLRDLSGTGARFLSECALSAGDSVALQLILPLSQQPVCVGARVTWVKPVQFRLVEVGVEFTDQEVPAQQAIDQAVQHFLRKKLGGD